MENIIRNIKAGQGAGEHTGYNLARKLADEHTKKSGNKCIVRRIVDYVDKYDGWDREHFSFDVVELID